MEAARFFMVSGISIFTLAILAGVSLTLVGMNQDQVISIVMSIMAFAGVIVGQYRNATESKFHIESVRRDIKTGNEVRGGQLREIKKTGEDTHSLVSSDYVATLKALAIARRQLALRTQDSVDLAQADKAESDLKKYENQRVDPTDQPPCEGK